MKWTFIEKIIGLSPARKEELRLERITQTNPTYEERRVAVIKNLYNKGLSVKDLAKAYASTENTIKQILGI